MAYGIQSHFAERARNARRLSLVSAALALALFAGLGLGHVPAVRRAVNNPERFGFEGPDHYVRRITIERPTGMEQSLRDLGQVLEHSTRRGGSRTPVRSRSPGAEPEVRRGIQGPGDSPEELLARAYSRRPDVPVVQSDELVVLKMVQPVYPEYAYEHDIEGRVTVMALVDTTGRVVEVDVFEGDAVARREFGEAASDAVWRFVFRPYRVGGKVIEVYVPVPFNFRIDRR